MKSILNKTLTLATLVAGLGSFSAEASYKDHCRRASERAAKKDVHKIEAAKAKLDPHYEEAQIVDSYVIDPNSFDITDTGLEEFEVVVATDGEVAEYRYYTVAKRHIQGRSCRVVELFRAN